MQTHLTDVFAAGDICHAAWEHSPFWLQVSFKYCDLSFFMPSYLISENYLEFFAEFLRFCRKSIKMFTYFSFPTYKRKQLFIVVIALEALMFLLIC